MIPETAAGSKAAHREAISGLSQALCDHRKPYPRTKELRGLTSGGEIAKAVKAIPDLDQTKHRKLFDNVRRQFAQCGELFRRIGLGLFLRRDFADPFEEPAFADNRDTIGFRLGQALRRPSVFLERPTELANDHDACILGDPLVGLSPMLNDKRDSVRPLHCRKPTCKGDDPALER